MALEAQWSTQTADDFEARTVRYEADGIAARWFLGPRNHTRVVPDSYKLMGDVDALQCSVPGPMFDNNEWLPLSEAARVLLSGEIRLLAELRVEALIIDFYKLRCWSQNCGRCYSMWWISEAKVISRCGAEGVIDGVLGFYAWHPWSTARIEELMQPHARRLTDRHVCPDPCRYESRHSKEAGKTYVTAVCPHCGAVQGDAYLLSTGPLRVHEIEVPLDAEARRAFRLASHSLKHAHRCTDIGNGRCQPPRQPDGEYTFAMPGVELD